MGAFLKKHWGLWFILFVWLAFAAPYLVKGKTPFPSTYQVNHFPPWNDYSANLGPVKNSAMPDVIDQIYPWRHLSIEEWKAGRVPLWNPYNFGGNPLLANFQSAVFSPVNVFFFIMPFVDAWTVSILIIPLLAGVCMYLFTKELEMKEASAALSSVTFMFCGFMTAWLAYGTLSLAAAFLPLALYAVERYVHTKKIWNLVLLAIAICLSILAGHFQTSLYVLIFIAAYVLYRTLPKKQYKSFLIITLFCIIGLFLAAPQLLPSIEFYLYSVRSELYNGSGGIPLHYLVTMFSPDFFGNPVTGNTWFGEYAEWASFIGIIPLMLVFTSLTQKRKGLWFFALSAMITLLFALDTPLQVVVGALHIPVLSTSYPARIIVLFSFAASVLAGFGLDALEQFRSKKNIKKVIVILSFGILIFGGIWIAIFAKMVPTTAVSIVKHNLVLPEIFFAVFVLSIMYLKITKSKYSLSVVIVILFIFSALDSYRFITKWMPADPKNLVFMDVPVLSAMQKDIGNGRYFGNLGAQVASYYRLSTTDGYDPLYVQWYGEFAQGAIDGTFMIPQRSVVQVPHRGKYTNRALNTLGVNFIFHPLGDTNQSWAYPVWSMPQDTKIYQDDTFALYKNSDAFSKATLFYSYVIIPDDKKAVETFYTDSFDYKKTLILSGKPNAPISKGSGKTSIEKNLPEDLKVSVQTSQNALLFVPDTYYPGWIATVDSKPTPIIRADNAFRAVVVPKGSHIVEFVYKPFSFTIGVILFIIGIVGVICSFIYLRHDEKRSLPSPSSSPKGRGKN